MTPYQTCASLLDEAEDAEDLYAIIHSADFVNAKRGMDEADLNAVRAKYCQIKRQIDEAEIEEARAKRYKGGYEAIRG